MRFDRRVQALAIVSALTLPLSASAEATQPVLAEAERLDRAAKELATAGRYEDAWITSQKALGLRVKVLGRYHLDVAENLESITDLLEAKGDYPATEPLYRQVVEIRARSLGKEHPDYAKSLGNLAAALYAQTKFEEAELLYRRTRAILERVSPLESEDVATALNNLGLLLKAKGDYAEAESLYRRALDLREKVHDTGLGLVTSLDNLAALLFARGDYAAAEPLFRRALTTAEPALGKDALDVAIALGNLAALLSAKGDYASAEPLYRRALAINEQKLGNDHPEVAACLNNLAELLRAAGDYTNAEPLLRRAAAIQRAAAGASAPDVATALSNLASLLTDKGDYPAAERLHREALQLREKSLGAKHPDVANSLNNIAWLASAQGDYSGAESLYRRALDIAERAFGSGHPDVALILRNLGALLWSTGDVAHGISVMGRAARASEEAVASVLVTGSERQKLAYLTTVSAELDQMLTLHLRSAPNSHEAARLALTSLLRRKARVLDAALDTVRQVRASAKPQDEAKLAALASKRSELATRTLRGPLPQQDNAEHRADLARLRAEIDALEQALAVRYAALRGIREEVDVRAVQRRLAHDSVLADLVVFQPYDPRGPQGHRFGEPHYAAYVLRASGEPAAIDLGPTAPIDVLVEKARRAFASQAADYATVARTLFAMVVQPLTPLFGEATHVYFAPDGALNLLAFAALRDAQDRVLIERYRWTYVTSGRDLLRMGRPSARREGALVYASPDYDAGATAPDEPGNVGQRSQQHPGSRRFTPLDGTSTEAAALSALLQLGPDAVRTGSAATELSLKRVRGPRLLHVATHGFFVSEAAQAAPVGTRGLHAVALETDSSLRFNVTGSPDPLLRSGFALAGANQGNLDGEDGIVTGAEILGLDLWGTGLVTLSACETGLGDTSVGEGVRGMRRALLLAGSEAQLISLWKVDDDATRALMVSYYRALESGQGRSEALRQAQLSMRHRHPFYWAGFILSGDPAPLFGYTERAALGGASPRVSSPSNVHAH